jgi:hypothetical protein
MNYDFKKAKKLILKHQKDLMTASLGMHEDWFWTTETAFENGMLTQDLDNITIIAGINGSAWATPTLRLEFKDGTDKMIPCHDGTAHTRSQPPFPICGVLSTPVQALITPLSKEEE